MRPEGRYSGVHVASCASLGRCCAYVKHILGRFYAYIGTSLEAPEWQNSLNTIRTLSCFRNRAFDATIGLAPLIRPLLGRSWALPGLCWALLVLSWALLGPVGAARGPVLGALGPLLTWSATGRSWPSLWHSWTNLGPICGPFATSWGTSLDTSGYARRLTTVSSSIICLDIPGPSLT